MLKLLRRVKDLIKTVWNSIQATDKNQICTLFNFNAIDLKPYCLSFVLLLNWFTRTAMFYNFSAAWIATYKMAYWVRYKRIYPQVQWQVDNSLIAFISEWDMRSGLHLSRIDSTIKIN